MNDVDGIAEDYRNEQKYFNSRCRPPRDKDGLVARYWRGHDCPDKYTCDVVYIDRMTSKEVMRYDGADPANTQFDYGAQTDEDCFIRKGLDLYAMIRPDQAKVSIEDCMKRMCADDWDDYE
jgi:hypothetical protein